MRERQSCWSGDKSKARRQIVEAESSLFFSEEDLERGCLPHKRSARNGRGVHEDPEERPRAKAADFFIGRTGHSLKAISTGLYPIYPSGPIRHL